MWAGVLRVRERESKAEQSVEYTVLCAVLC